LANLPENKKIGPWAYKENVSSEPLIVLPVKLLLPGSDQFSHETELIVDTGYDGDVILSFDLFQLARYDYFTIPKSKWSIGQTITGEEIELPITQTLIEVNGNQFEVFIESHYSIDESLLGRRFLNKLITILDGPNLMMNMLL